MWGFGKERSRCFWIEDYRPADSRKRDTRRLRSARGKRSGQGVDEVRPRRPRKMRRKAAERRGRDGEGEINNEDSPQDHYLDSERVSHPLPLAPLFSSLASFCALDDTTPDIPPGFQQGPYTGKIHPLFPKVNLVSSTEISFFLLLLCSHSLAACITKLATSWCQIFPSGVGRDQNQS